MKRFIFFIGIIMLILPFVTCQKTIHIWGENYERKNKKYYTGRTYLLDDRLFIVADILNIEIREDSSFVQVSKGYDYLVNIEVIIKNAYIHKRLCRYITFSPCLFQLTTPEDILKNETTMVKIRTHNINGLQQIGKKNCLLGIDKNFYLSKKGSLDSAFGKDAAISMIAPCHTYSLDSLIVYDSFYNSWKKECDGGIY